MKHHIKDLYIEAVEKEYCVEKWDLSGIYKMNCVSADLVENVLKMRDFDELETNLKRVTETDNIVIITNILKQVLVKINDLFKKYNVTTVSITKESQYIWIRHRTYIDFFKEMSLDKKLKAIPANSKILSKLYHCLKYKNVMFDYMLASGNYQPELCKNFYQIHHVKYDEYLQALNSDSVINGEYILFLDSAFPDHPSFKGKINSLKHNEYVKDMSVFFERVEKHFHIPVVISAHPKSNYAASDFGGRAVVKYKTPELIQHSKIIIAHQTTSLINAILLYKPINIVFNKKIMKSCAGDDVRNGFEIAKLIGANIVDMDDRNIEVSNEVNKEKYEWFITNHVLNMEKMKLSNAEILSVFLRELQDSLDKKNA
jgi:hypothetical protein